MKLSKFTHDLSIWSLIIASIVLIIISAIVRDYKFIINNPKGFIFELLAFSIVPPLVIAFVFFKTRGITVKDTILWFVWMVLKFAAFHIFFQLSGVYTILFSL